MSATFLTVFSELLPRRLCSFSFLSFFDLFGSGVVERLDELRARFFLLSTAFLGLFLGVGLFDNDEERGRTSGESVSLDECRLKQPLYSKRKGHVWCGIAIQNN